MTRPAPEPEQVFAAALSAHSSRSLLVALSGGLDSMVLLDLAQRHAAAQGLGVRALHVNHHLQEAALEFEAHCRRQCGARQLALQVLHVQVAPVGEGLEAAARAARYRALASAARPGELLLLGHHADDEQETLLLNLMRGAGLDGLAGMRAAGAVHGVAFVRPLLRLRRAQLARYAEARQLSFIDDPSNTDRRYTRNFLRHELLPLMRSRRPGVDAVLARTSELLQESATLQDEYLSEELVRLRRGPHALFLPELQRRGEPRQRALLCHWLKTLGVRVAGRERMREFVRQLAGEGERFLMEMDGRQFRITGDCLLYLPSALPAMTALRWNLGEPLSLPGVNSTLCAIPLAPAELTLEVAGVPEMSRRVLLPGHRQHKTLKHVLQELQLPAWLRPSWPCVYREQELLGMPGLWWSERGRQWQEEHRLQIRLQGYLDELLTAWRTPGAPAAR
jgi:tRNA(Ile)-lysidine synthase